MALENAESDEFLKRLLELTEDLGVEYNLRGNTTFVDSALLVKKGIENRDFRAGSVLGRDKRAMGSLFTALFIYLETLKVIRYLYCSVNVYLHYVS